MPQEQIRRSQFTFTGCACEDCDGDYVNARGPAVLSTGFELGVCQCGTHTEVPSTRPHSERRCRISGMTFNTCELATCPMCNRRCAKNSLCSICGGCILCCPPILCESCGHEVHHDRSSLCQCCERCRSCCTCITCAACDCQVSALCNGCGVCADCCRCRCTTCGDLIDSDSRCQCGSALDGRHHHAICCAGRTLVYGESGNRKIPTKPNECGRRFVKTKHEFDIPRLVGLEIEVADYAKVSSYSRFIKWLIEHGCDAVRDGSLPSSGIEYVTAPWAGMEFKKNIKYICNQLAHYEAVVNDKCGLHVHVDARDFTAYDLRRLILLWNLLEPQAMAMIPASRRRKDMCKPLDLRKIAKVLKASKSPMLTKYVLYGMLYGEVGGAVKHKLTKYGSMRYYAMNLHSWNIRRTVEFRMPPGTVDEDVMVFWAAFCSQVVEFAYKSKESSLYELLAGTGMLELLPKILDSKTHDFGIELIK